MHWNAPVSKLFVELIRNDVQEHSNGSMILNGHDRYLKPDTIPFYGCELLELKAIN